MKKALFALAFAGVLLAGCTATSASNAGDDTIAPAPVSTEAAPAPEPVPSPTTDMQPYIDFMTGWQTKVAQIASDADAEDVIAIQDDCTDFYNYVTQGLELTPVPASQIPGFESHWKLSLSTMQSGALDCEHGDYNASAAAIRKATSQLDAVNNDITNATP